MCLDTRYDKKTEKKMIAKLPDEFVVYKVVCLYPEEDFYRPEFRNGSLGVGVCESAPDPYIVKTDRGKEYVPHFHSFKTIKGVKRWGATFTVSRIVRCRCRREWVTAIGTQRGHSVIVSRKIIMPSPKDKKAIVA